MHRIGSNFLSAKNKLFIEDKGDKSKSDEITGATQRARFPDSGLE